MNVKKTAVVLNGFVHDFSFGYWFATIIVIRILHRFQENNPAVSGLLNGIQDFFFWNSVAAGVIIFVTGAGRTFTYVDNVFGEQTEETRRRLLIIKHVVLIAIFGTGGWWAYSMTFP